MTDAELLDQHRQGSQGAFAELVRRHINWVYSVARRRVHDAHLAEDVTQSSFVILARKSPRLGQAQPLSAWLFNVVSLASKAALRTESRRRRHETEAAKMRDRTSPSDVDCWEALTPDLDRLIGRLRSNDRKAVLLRFYQQMSFAEVGEALAISEVAARRRVSRAIERLRLMLPVEHTALSATALAGVMLTHATIPAPPSLASNVASASAATAQSGTVLVKLVIAAMKWSRLKIAATACVTCIVLGTAAVILVAQLRSNGSSPAVTQPTAEILPTAESVLAAINKHDAQITSIQVDYAFDVGIKDGKPTLQLTGSWLAKGALELLIENEPLNQTTGFDGQFRRSLRPATQGARAEAIIAKAQQADFARNNHMPRGFTARCVWEQPFLPWLKSGKAAVMQNPVIYDGHRCFELSGSGMTAKDDGQEAMWFRITLDPQCGCMPRYLEEFNLNEKGEQTSRNIMDEYVLTEIRPGIWYPTSLRQQALLRNDKGEWETRTVNRVRLTKLVVNETIPDEKFTIQFPPDARVVDMSNGMPRRIR